MPLSEKDRTRLQHVLDQAIEAMRMAESRQREIWIAIGSSIWRWCG